MRASFLFEGGAGQLEFVSTCLRRGLQSLEWPHVMAYDTGLWQRHRLRRATEAVRDAWWPVARTMLAEAGAPPAAATDALRSATHHLSDAIAEILGPEQVAKLSEPADAYFACGPLPVEWLLVDGLPLCLHSPVYRFARPQDVLSQNPPPPELGASLVVAPAYEKPSLAALNASTAKSAAWVGGQPDVTLLEGKVEASRLAAFADGQFARLVFHGHAKGDLVLDSGGRAIPLDSLLRCVRGGAYVLGCAAGDFPAAGLESAAKAIPRGLHGALLCAFPSPNAYTDRVAQIVLANFARPGGLRIQDVAHMARLALASMSLRHLGGHAPDSDAVTPFEADYAAYGRWGAGVERLRAEAAQLLPDAGEAPLSVAGAFAMTVASCGTPMFLLPDAHPLLRRFFKAFAAWDGSAAAR